MSESEDKDWEGKAVAEFIGRRTIYPPGVIIGGYIDACDVMLFDIKLDDGSELVNSPRTTTMIEVE